MSADENEVIKNGDTEDPSILERRQKTIDRAPFVNLKITDSSILDTIVGREICGICYKSRKFFCYTCCRLVIDEKYIPRVKLPINIDIIKHAREIDGKSTAIHAAVIAPDNVRIYTYPDFPEITKDEKSQVVLIFPDKNASTVDELFDCIDDDDDDDDDNGKEEEAEIKEDNQDCGAAIKSFDDNLSKNIIINRYERLPIKRAIFIDSTWHQTKSIYKDQRLRDIRCVVIKSRISQFWRHQKSSPRWYLATIEAIHQFLIELHAKAYGIDEYYFNKENCIFNKLESSIKKKNFKVKNSKSDDKQSNLSSSSFNNNNNKKYDDDDYYEPYKGQYDDLLFFFKYMYEKIHTIYDHDKLWAYKRPLI